MFLPIPLKLKTKPITVTLPALSNLTNQKGAEENEDESDTIINDWQINRMSNKRLEILNQTIYAYYLGTKRT